jgi:cystathionine beta-lyase/cystathionine gamma-synthase
MPRHVDTDLIHAGEPRPRIAGAIAMPIFQSATYEYRGEGSYHDVRYMRLSNSPNHLAVQQKLAALEGGEAALVTASGMAAIAAALLASLGAGDHLLAQECLYGGTHDLVTRDLAALGIGHTFIDARDPSGWQRALRPTTRAIYVETMTNPLLQVADHRAIAAFARAHQLVSIIDNTLATPLGFRPLAVGYDLVVHSCTKYLNGHSDVIAGAAIGRAELVARVKHKLDHLGGCLDAHACYLLHRGIKTLAVRFRHQCATALALARFLAEHPAVARVNYPGLAGHPDHGRASALLSGHGALLSFEPAGGVMAADKFLASVELAVSAPSLGGVETLATRPATTSHAGLAVDERRRLGIGDALVRLSVGLEAVDDLRADLASALA